MIKHEVVLFTLQLVKGQLCATLFLICIALLFQASATTPGVQTRLHLFHTVAVAAR